MHYFKLLTGCVLIFMTLSFSGCPPDTVLHGKWEVVAFRNHITQEEILKTEENTWDDGDNTIIFSKINNKRGTVSGKNVTNDFSGKYYTDEYNRLVIIDLIWTEIAEPFWGQLFHYIAEVETYELGYGELILYYDSGNKSILLHKTGE